MFARSHLVQTSLAQANKEKEKDRTDEELLREAEEEEEKQEAFEQAHNPDNYTNFITSEYVRISNLARNVTAGPHEHYFNTLMIFVILIAGLLVGIQTYKSLENNVFLGGLESFCLACFIIECLLKIIAEGLKPWHYFIGPEGGWNSFDFLVILVSSTNI